MNYEWFLFDLDGTLAESGAGILNSVRYALTQLGAEIPPEEEMRAFIGPPLLWSFQNVAHLPEETARRAVDLYRERYGREGWMETSIYPGVQELLRGIRRRGGKIALASAKPQGFCEKILVHFGLEKYFDRVSAISLTDHHPEKRDIILRALPEEADRARAVMVGDRVYDIEGALQAGVTPVAAGYGYGNPGEFDRAAAVARTPRDLWDVLVGEARDPGHMVTFEGVDGSGKSTQFHLAVEYFRTRGWDVLSSREPGGCPISEKVRELILDVANREMTPLCEAYLYAAARAQHVSQVLRPALREGKLVLCDRFLDSSIAYQAYGRELTEPLIRQINKPAVDGLEPDLTLVYALPAAEAKRRVAQNGAPDRLEIEGLDFVGRVQAGYDALAAAQPQRLIQVDSGRSIEAVFADTGRLISRLLA